MTPTINRMSQVLDAPVEVGSATSKTGRYVQ